MLALQQCRTSRCSQDPDVRTGFFNCNLEIFLRCEMSPNLGVTKRSVPVGSRVAGLDQCARWKPSSVANTRARGQPTWLRGQSDLWWGKLFDCSSLVVPDHFAWQGLHPRWLVHVYVANDASLEIAWWIFKQRINVFLEIFLQYWIHLILSKWPWILHFNTDMVRRSYHEWRNGNVT